MRTLDAFVEAHREDGTIIVAHIIEIDRPNEGTLRYTDINRDIRWGSNTWTARPFAVPGVTEALAAVDDAKLEIDDVDGVVRVLIDAEDDDIEVTIWELWADSDRVIQGANWLYTGFVDDMITTPVSTALPLRPGPEPSDVIVPNVRHSRTCPLPYKGTLCGYSGSEPPGETTCRKRLSDCEARSNEDRFGGDPYIPEAREYRTQRGTINLRPPYNPLVPTNPSNDGQGSNWPVQGEPYPAPNAPLITDTGLDLDF